MDVTTDTPEIAAARRAYNEASDLFERRIAEREIAKQVLADARCSMENADAAWEEACGETNRAFDVLRDAVAAAKAGV